MSKIVLRNVTHQSQLDGSTNCDRGENDGVARRKRKEGKKKSRKEGGERKERKKVRSSYVFRQEEEEKKAIRLPSNQ